MPGDFQVVCIKQVFRFNSVRSNVCFLSKILLWCSILYDVVPWTMTLSFWPVSSPMARVWPVLSREDMESVSMEPSSEYSPVNEPLDRVEKICGGFPQLITGIIIPYSLTFRFRI